MSEFEFDLFVIGAGSGGVRAARMAAAAGMRVAVAEDRYMGGTCVNVGCVPKKLFVYASSYSESFEDSVAYGWRGKTAEFDWPILRDNNAAEITRLNGIYRNLLANAGVLVVDGRARVEGRHQVAVGDRVYSAERILVATGSWPYVPEFPGREYAITSNEIFSLETFPRRILVVGGGYIAVEFAGIFAGLGAETHLSYRRDLFLRGFDRDIREFVRDEIGKKGVQLHFNHRIEAIEKQDDGSLLVRGVGGGGVLAVDTVLYATGRVANTGGLGLEALGVVLHRDGTISVDDNFRTSVPSIYALGDVTGEPQLTPVALAEAMALVKHLQTGQPAEIDYNYIPTAVFCQPNIGTVGLSEEEARDSGISVVIYKSDFKPMRHTVSGRDERTLMKLVVDADTDRVVGVHMVGPDAGEIIQGMAVALKAGATKAVFDQTIGIHPTAAEEFVTMRNPVA